jgi:hypothetical protein
MRNIIKSPTEWALEKAAAHLVGPDLPSEPIAGKAHERLAILLDSVRDSVRDDRNNARNRPRSRLHAACCTPTQGGVCAREIDHDGYCDSHVAHEDGRTWTLQLVPPKSLV